MPQTPGTSDAVLVDPAAHYSTTKPGVASQTLNPNVGIEAGRSATVEWGESEAATELPVDFTD